jgi:hypothetical protein
MGAPPRRVVGPGCARRSVCSMSPVMLLTCADPLNPRRADPHFAREAAAARELGMPVALIDHDALAAGDVEAAVRRVPATDVACRADGVWRVIEVGDGQVSDLPSTADPAALLRRLSEVS